MNAVIDKKERERRRDFEQHQQLIHDAYLRLIQDNKGRQPSAKDLARETNLSQSTIERHFTQLTFEPLRHRMRILTPEVITAIWRKAVGGNVPAQRLWLQVMEGWSERMEVKHSNDPDNPVPASVNTTVINVREFVARKLEERRSQEEVTHADGHSDH